MLRGKTWFRCPFCGEVFKSWDVEDNATVNTMPMPCPKCGTESPAIRSIGILDRIRILLKG